MILRQRHACLSLPIGGEVSRLLLLVLVHIEGLAMASSRSGDRAGCRAVVYARYSTDLQSASSIEDQARICTALAERSGWQIVQHYADRALSGASILRLQLKYL